MCLLCAVQKWSRRVATMLPWLVIPLIGLWALSQFFPPGFRFEITSPQLACVFVLLVTLFWYEVLMPQLSTWRIRRSARIRQIKRFEAIELQKLRKMATRRCRNCLNPYRDQNPAGGRFMCSYCGHISKRPVLDMPGPAGLSISSSGVIGGLVDEGGKMRNEKVWLGNGWNCGHHWIEKGNFLSRSLPRKSNYYRKNGCFGSDDHCSTEKSFSGVIAFTSRIFELVFLLLRWLWRKIFRISSSDDPLSDEEGKEMFNKNENGINFHESKVEKARRKAEEKRQARLERELLEEEERKQREEVAMLVEEQRKLRDEKMEAEKEHFKGLAIDKENDRKREVEKKHQERRKEKDRGSSKSNSDCEELERRVYRESEKKRELDRIEIERDIQKTTKERARTQSSDMVQNVSNAGTTYEFSRGASTRYLDRVKGSFLSSSKAFKGATFFGKGARTSARVVPEASKPVGSLEHIDASSSTRKVALEIKSQTVPKKSWRQLFTRSPVGSTPSNANVTRRPNQKAQADAQSLHVHGQSSLMHLSDQISYGLPLPFTPFPNSVQNGIPISSSAAEPIFPLIGKPPHDFMSEEQEIFEDPCYVPDPMSLLGPVSESLDQFPSEFGNGILKDTVLERPNVLKNVYASVEVNKPSPIEAPNSRSRITEERHTNDSLLPSNTKNRNVNSSALNESIDAHEQGTWHMWDTAPLGQDGLSLVGGTASWILPIGQNKSNQKVVSHHSSNKAMGLELAEENQPNLSIFSPHRVSLDNCRNQGTPICPGLEDNQSWLQKSVLQPLSGDEDNHLPLPIAPKDISRNEVTDGSSEGSAAGNQFDVSPSIYWSNEDLAVNGSEEGIRNLALARPPVGGLFSTTDVQSLWSYN